ncbi:MAG: hypothetical protein U0031_02090 [Thermomicrobiales bacterium]
MHAKVLTLALAGALTLVGMPAALAQEATPVGAPNLFADLGLPELSVTASGNTLSVDQAEIPSGRYLVHLVDEIGNPDLATGFVRLDEGETLNDLSYADEIAAGTPAPAEEPPVDSYAFLYDNYISGGPSAVSPYVVVDLPAGDYGIWPDNPFSDIPAAALTVTGDPSAQISGPEPEASATIVEEGQGGQAFKFTVDGGLQAGPQIVKIVNASDQPHFVIAFQYPEPITQDQVMNALMFDPSSGATPSPDMLDFGKMAFNGYASAQSAGTTQWVVMNLTSGQAVLACFISDPKSGGVPHAFEGMVHLVDVSGS